MTVRFWACASIALASLPLAIANEDTTSKTTAAATEPADETVLVIGQREAPMTVVPRGLSVSLGAEQFEAINALNVEDLMKYAPNFFVRKRFAGDDNAVVALRGATEVWLAQQSAYDLWQARLALKKSKALQGVKSAAKRAA